MHGAQHQSRQVGPGRFEGAPVAKWLLILNVAIFLIDIAGVEATSWGRLTPLGLFAVGDHLYNAGTFIDSLRNWHVWRLISFQFLHADFSHLIFNMLGVFMFGGIVERLIGSARFLVYYLLCGVGGALFFALLANVGWLDEGVLVGASAGIFGILMALIIAAPTMLVQPILLTEPITMRTMGIVVLGIGVLTVLSVGENAGGEAGHLGGAIIGFVLMKNPALLAWASGARSLQFKKKKGPRNYVPKIRPRTSVSMDSSEVDKILDKVSEQGLHSLTDEERALLKKISEKNKQ